MVRPEKVLRPSGTCTIPFATILFGFFGSGSPKNSTLPFNGFTRPEMVRSSVLFPAPFAPMMETICPCST